MPFRTDLATEAVTDRGGLSPEDLRLQEDSVGGIRLTRTEVRSARAERLLQKPQGRYVTAELPVLTDHDGELLKWARLLGGELAALLPPEGPVLVLGLGNAEMTADALGPQTVRRVLATRHIEGEYARTTGLDDLRPTAVLSPGVCGQTGLEIAELVSGVCRAIRPAAVIAVDALAARTVRHLGRTVQLTDGGITPGSGVGNRRVTLSGKQLGIPVIALGVPTVVDAHTLIADLTGMELSAAKAPTSFVVTPQEVDLLVRRAARLLAMTIHAALQPAYSPLELMSITE